MFVKHTFSVSLNAPGGDICGCFINRKPYECPEPGLAPADFLVSWSSSVQRCAPCLLLLRARCFPLGSYLEISNAYLRHRCRLDLGELCMMCFLKSCLPHSLVGTTLYCSQKCYTSVLASIHFTPRR